MEFLSRDQIDTQKWDARIAADPVENIYCYAWYLDISCEHWGAFVEGDYQTIVPIPYKKTLGVRTVYNPPFTREIDIFGHSIQWEELFFRFSKNYKSVHFRNAEANIIEGGEKRFHQYLNLKDDLKYSTNAKRLIKKADKKFTYEKSDDPSNLIEIFEETAFQKIDSITDSDLKKLNQLMKKAIDLGHGELFEVFEDDIIVGGGFFYKDKKRITYLKGASTASAKKEGAMYGLVNFGINRFKEDYHTFDFGGSDVENVATFYKKFGAKDRVYYDYLIDNLPLWFKTLKKIKR